MKKKRVHHKPQPKTLPGKEEGGIIAAKMKDAALFGKKTDDFQVVTPFEHAPGTV